LGHFAAECWDNPENASKRPAWYTPKAKTNEVNNTATGKGKTNKFELLFCTIGKQLFLDSIGLLTNPNIWIADTGATSNTTFDDEYIYATTKLTDSDTAKTASGHWLKAMKVGKLDAILCDN
jgi:hypothetical protein